MCCILIKCCILSGKATNTNFIVFGLTQSGLEPTNYCTQGEHAKHYTTDAVIDKTLLLFSKVSINDNTTKMYMYKIFPPCLAKLVSVPQYYIYLPLHSTVSIIAYMSTRLIYFSLITRISGCAINRSTRLIYFSLITRISGCAINRSTILITHMEYLHTYGGTIYLEGLHTCGGTTCTYLWRYYIPRGTTYLWRDYMYIPMEVLYT